MGRAAASHVPLCPPHPLLLKEHCSERSREPQGQVAPASLSLMEVTAGLAEEKTQIEARSPRWKQFLVNPNIPSGNR